VPGSGWPQLHTILKDLKRQILWLGCLLFLLLGTFCFPFHAVADWLRESSAPVVFAGSLLLAYAWIRFCIVLWKPLYHQEVSPGWVMVLPAALFAVIFLLMRMFYILEYVNRF
jgi:hypothetical protein